MSWLRDSSSSRIGGKTSIINWYIVRDMNIFNWSYYLMINQPTFWKFINVHPENFMIDLREKYNYMWAEEIDRKKMQKSSNSTQFEKKLTQIFLHLVECWLSLAFGNNIKNCKNLYYTCFFFCFENLFVNVFGKVI